MHILDNGDLEIQLTPEGKVILEENLETGEGAEFTMWNTDWDSIFSELFEDIFGNSDWDILRPEDIGVLTNAPIIGYGVDTDDDGSLTDVLDVFWFPNYQVEDPLEILYNEGKVVFTHVVD